MQIQPREDDVVNQTLNDVIAIARTHTMTEVRFIMTLYNLIELDRMYLSRSDST